MATASTLHGQPSANDNPDRFSSEAASWDSNPFVHLATNAAYKALQNTIPALSQATAQETSKIDVLEIGCGTGLLSLLTASNPSVRTVVAVDAAPGMIDVLKSKLSPSGANSTVQNIVPICVLLEDPEDPSLPPSPNQDAPNGRRLKFDLITSHLVLHHIPDAAVLPVLRTMHGCLKPGGQIAITDFEDYGPEAKRFHPKSRLDSVERHGIQRDWIRGLLTEVGFDDISVEAGFALDKVCEKFEGEFGERAAPVQGEGVVQNFPFLVIRGFKR